MMKVLKRVLRGIVNVISVAVILLAIVMLLSVVMTRSGDAPNFLGYSVFRVMSGSMEPSIPTDSLIIVHKTEAKEVKVGDVISFYSRDPSLGGAINTHRVTQITEEDGKLSFMTKGDANVIEDRYLTQEADLIGVVVFSSFALGTLVRIVSNPLVFIPLIVIPLLVLMTMNFVKTIRLSKRMLDEEMNEQPEAASAQADEPQQMEEKNEGAP